MLGEDQSVCREAVPGEISIAPLSVGVGAAEKLSLALSGGGFRAALFHLGVLRRLNELGVLSRLDHVSSVSGGSIVAAHIALVIQPWPEPGEVVPEHEWDRKVADPLRVFCSRNIRTGVVGATAAN